MLKLNNDLLELVKSHISIYENFENSRGRSEQLDFLAFRVDENAMSKNSPFIDLQGYCRDNPNWQPTKYDNVYQLVESDKIVLQYVREGYTPVAILQWYKMKLPGKGEKRKISVYGKGLRLYYCGYLDWLPDYINEYASDVIRADLCWDNDKKIPSAVVDLPNTVTYGEGENRTYKGFGNKKSPLFIRIYDKTLDLAKDHNCMSWLYPDWYTSCCRRIECKFTQRYAQSMTALEWLGVIERNGKIENQKSTKRNYLKSAFYNLLMYVDFIPDRKLQYEILDSVKNMCVKKIKKLKDFISLDCEND